LLDLKNGGEREHHVDLEKMARKLGVLHDWEVVG
jgi:hypothetical protein